MKNKFIFIFLCLATALAGQTCELNLSGTVKDQFTQEPLSFANVWVEETQNGTVTDSLGQFALDKMCEGKYHLRVSHIGCSPSKFYLVLQADTSLQIELDHHEEFLHDVIVEESSQSRITQTQGVLSEQAISREGGKTISEMITGIAGVSSIKNGSGIAKPVIHGMYGNRVAVLNNGIVQAGQQWGNDHAPEIDPFTANRISVIKGVDAIAYGGNSLGGVVLVEPGPIRTDPHLHGAASYIFQTNGRGHTVSTRLAKSGKWVNWRVTGTAKYIGDRHTPDYFLANTGSRENNFSVQLTKDIKGRWFNQVYYSYFNTRLGVLRGSHIGNLTDLEQAIGKKEPFFTKEKFSYAIEAPRQKVQHHLLKASSKYYLQDHQVLELIYGGQINKRKEFDIRRGNRSDIPALDLTLNSHFVEGNYSHTFPSKGKLKVGLQGKYNDSKNNPGTGILPLIPNYELFNVSSFATYSQPIGRWTYELGGRYDYQDWRVVNITNDFPPSIERITHQYHNYAFAAGLQFDVHHDWKSKINIGLTKRSPEINELYSFGLHQGVSGIEEGNRDLQSERALKVIATQNILLSKRLFFEISAYYQWIEDYIFLEPQEDFRLTIRGFFPVFLYQQANSNIGGIDVTAKYEISNNIEWIGKFAMVRGENKVRNQPLNFIPADNLYSSLSYSFPNFKKLEEPRISVSGKYVWQPEELDPEQDFLEVPEAYFLLGLSLDTKLVFAYSDLRISFQVENLLNERYRDYLNRLRYYADEEGINFRVNLRYGF